ncbi:MAG: tRNA lysidine(34) synthetase TilS [Bdellovibrionales bacterium]|nr:tRNA lysidine(34) synthetase TilS [Bdellovibrionales bacterium]
MKPRKAESAYPVPGPVGGRLARKLVAAVRKAGLEPPLASHILCACSGGADSVALAVLLARYGRRVGAHVVLLHVNHGWRGRASDADEAFVKKLAARLGAGFVGRRLKERPGPGDSWEAHARDLRKAVFRRESERRGGAPVFTAHTADDQAETRLWRLFTGAFAELGRGILDRHGPEVRPLLGVRRSELRVFLAEEKQRWREDASNADRRFLRAQMRQDLMPVIERLFPRAIDAINHLAPPTRS